MGDFMNICKNSIYFYHNGKWNDVTDALEHWLDGIEEEDDSVDDIEGDVYEIDDDEIPFCDEDCDNCPETDQLDDYEVVDEDDFDVPYDYEPPFWGIPDIKRIVFNDPATIVFWDDGTKTVVKTCEGDKFERYMGFAMACMKKMFGSTIAAKSIMEDCDTENLKLMYQEAVKPKKEKPQKEEFKEPSLYNLIESLLEVITQLTKSKEKAEEK